MKKFKGFIAALTALATVASSASVVAFAQSGGATGNGSVEGIVKKEVFNVVLPTTSEVAPGTFDFILDPQGLIAATSTNGGGAYGSATFTQSKYLFFKNSSGNYSDASDELTAYNLSNKAVDLTVTGTITGADGITFVTGAPTDDAAQIQLQIDGTNNDDYFETADDGTATATITENLAALPSDKFEVKYTAGASGTKGTYSYGLMAGVDKNTPGVAKATFKLVGAASKNEDGTAWANLKGVAPEVNITWEIKSPFATGPSATTTVTASTTALTIPFDLGSGDAAALGIAKVEFKGASAADWSEASSLYYTVTDNKLIWSSESSAYLVAGSQVRITFDDSASTSVTVNVQ